MQVTNFVDASNTPVINAIVATTSYEEQLLALFEDLTDADKAKVLHFVESLSSSCTSS